MKTYFRITSTEEREAWEGFRKQWLAHRDAVLTFMNDVLKAEQVRVNFAGAPIAAIFPHNMSEEINPVETYFQQTTDRNGYRTMNKKGIRHFADQLNAIADLYPTDLPGSCAQYRRDFDIAPVWRSETTPIYLAVKSERVRLGTPFPYREMCEKEYEFRKAADDFLVANKSRYLETLHALAAAEPEMVKTDDCANEQELRELFSMDADDPALEDVIAVCDGEWIRPPNHLLWRFWRNKE